MKRPCAVFGSALLISLAAAFFIGKYAVFALFAAFGIAATAFSKFGKNKLSLTAITSAAACVLAALLFIAFYECTYIPSLLLADNTVCISGTAQDYAFTEYGKKAVILKNCVINGTKTKLKIKLICDSLPSNFEPYDSFSASTAQIEQDESSDIYFINSLSDGCWLSAKTNSVTVTQSNKKPLSAYIAIFRQSTKNIINAAITDRQCASIANALLSGSSKEMSQELRSKLSVSGASHIFAVSGMHLALWTGILLFLLNKIKRSFVITPVIICVFIIIYAVFTGLSPSVLRSAFMLITMLCGTMLRRKGDAVNSLGLAATVLLTVNPCLAGSISFLLSALATAAIAGLMPKITSSSHSIKKVFDKGILSTVAASLSVLLITAPVCAAFFGQLSLLSPISSVLLTLPCEGVMVSSFLCVITSSVPILGRFFAIVCSLLTGTVSYITDSLSKLEFAVCAINASQLAIWYAVTIIACTAAYFISKKNTAKTVYTLIISITVLLCSATAAELIQKEDIYLYFPNTTDLSPAAVVTDCGAKSAQIDLADQYEDTKLLRSFYTAHTVISNDVQITPCKTNYFEAALNSKLNLKCCSASGYSAVVIYANGIKYVYSAATNADFTLAPNELKCGDRLICKNTLPKGINAEDFCSVTVLTHNDNEKISAESSSNIYKTGSEVTIRIRNGAEQCLY